MLELVALNGGDQGSRHEVAFRTGIDDLFALAPPVALSWFWIQVVKMLFG